MKTLLTLLLLSPLSSCAWLASAVTPSHSIDARTAGPLMLDVLEQHDESVVRDPELVEAEKAQALRGSQIVREIITSAGGAK